MNYFTQFEEASLADQLIQKAISYKNAPRKDQHLGAGKRIGLLFLNPSLRTRVSTQIAATNLGMEAIVLNMDKESWALEMQDGAIMNQNKVEHIKDAAGVLGSYFDVLALRAFPSLTDKSEDSEDYILHQFIKHSGLPLISL